MEWLWLFIGIVIGVVGTYLIFVIPMSRILNSVLDDCVKEAIDKQEKEVDKLTR